MVTKYLDKSKDKEYLLNILLKPIKDRLKKKNYHEHEEKKKKVSPI